MSPLTLGCLAREPNTHREVHLRMRRALGSRVWSPLALRANRDRGAVRARRTGGGQEFDLRIVCVQRQLADAPRVRKRPVGCGARAACKPSELLPPRPQTMYVSPPATSYRSCPECRSVRRGGCDPALLLLVGHLVCSLPFLDGGFSVSTPNGPPCTGSRSS
jgi:hypothetical protein